MKNSSDILSCWSSWSGQYASFIFMMLLAGCSSIPEFGAVVSDAISNDTYTIEVRIETSDNLNPDANGRPSPVQVRIFQLKDDSSFQKLSLDELLFLKNESFATHNIITVDDSTLFPATKKTLELSVSSDATFLGVLAAFQNESGSIKKAVKVTGKWNRDLCISLTESDIKSGNLC